MDLGEESGLTLKKKRNKRNTTDTMTNADNEDDLTLLANAPAQAQPLLLNQEKAARDIGLNVIADKRLSIFYKKDSAIPNLFVKLLKLVDQII